MVNMAKYDLNIVKKMFYKAKYLNICTVKVDYLYTPSGLYHI